MLWRCTPAEPARCLVLKLDRKFDFLLHNDPRHSFFRLCIEEEQAKLEQQQGGSDVSTPGALHSVAAYGSSDTSDSESALDGSAPLVAAHRDDFAVDGLGNPITAATLSQVKPPKGVTLPDDPAVLAMLAKLLEFRRTFTGTSWPGFLAQLQQQESARPGPSRFTFLLPESPYHDFWLWAVKAAKAHT